MKISKLFHWLYASVMMLPLVVAPIFAIYMHRHPVTNYEVAANNYLRVNFNQLINLDNETFNLTSINNRAYLITDDDDDDITNGKYLLKWTQFDTITSAFRNTPYYELNGNATYFNVENSYTFHLEADNYYWFFDIDVDDISNFQLVYWVHSIAPDSLSLGNFCLFNLTQMFGSGNEPSTIETFEYYFSDTYYSYTTSDIVYVCDGSVIYNDTDIGSQFIYSIYLPLNKYFNVTNFLGLNNLYSWINTNVFSGASPLGFNIFYILLSYWFLVSILWLVFDVVMYVPNLAHKWLDKASID